MSVYATIDDLKEYGRVQAPVGAVMSGGVGFGIDVNTDDALLEQQLVRAVCAIDHFCGTTFAHLTNVDELARKCWVDGNGWLQVQTHKPIYDPAGITVSIMDVKAGAIDWTALTLKQCICMAPVNDGDAPRAQAWHYAAAASVPLRPALWGDILVRTSYPSGYPTIPGSLRAITVRLAWFYYKLREAPMVKIETLGMGTVEVPQEMPKDVKGELMTWRRPM